MNYISIFIVVALILATLGQSEAIFIGPLQQLEEILHKFAKIGLHLAKSVEQVLTKHG